MSKASENNQVYLGSNVKLLRKRKGRTQDVVAAELGISRSTLNNYENNSVQNPTMELLIKLALYFKVSIDSLVRVNLAQLRESQLSELERGHDVYITGSRLRVLATTTTSDNRENIEVVNQKASAGYRMGYTDLDFISKLPSFQLPILFNDRKYRMFQITGDSMLPIPDKAFVIGEYVESFYDIKDGHAYIVLTREDGIVFKILYNHLRKKKTLQMVSLNNHYTPYEINANEICEVWRFCNYISHQIPDPVHTTDLVNGIRKIDEQLTLLKKLI
jgi:transcriptional regulator with XRE-family HTH domain